MKLRPKVYITRQFPQKGLEALCKECNVSFWDSADTPVTRSELLHSVEGVDAILSMPTDKIDKQVLQAAGPSLKIVATFSEDADHIDLVECNRRQVRAVTIPTVSMEALSDLTLALLLQTTAKWMEGEGENADTILNEMDLTKIKSDKAYTQELSNSTLGIFGMGSLGYKIGCVLKDLGIARVIYYDLSEVAMAGNIDAKFVPFETFLKESDIVCVCSNIRPETSTGMPMFKKDTFKMMKDTAILIDATKGPVINSQDLYEALKNGEISAAGLDVREYGTSFRHPLSSLSNCFFLPYKEVYKWDKRRDIAGVLAQRLLAALKDNNKY